MGELNDSWGEEQARMTPEEKAEKANALLAADAARRAKMTRLNEAGEKKRKEREAAAETADEQPAEVQHGTPSWFIPEHSATLPERFPMIEPGARDESLAETPQFAGEDRSYGLDLRLPMPTTETADRILYAVLPEALSLFIEKNNGYGEMANVLGPRAQFVDIHRKVDKLKRALWEGSDIGAEDAAEVTRDLFGHCLLLLDMLTFKDSDE